MLKSGLRECSDAYMLVKGTITVSGSEVDAEVVEADRNNTQVIFQCCSLFTNCINEIINTQVDNGKDLDVGMLMYNLIEYNDNYEKTLGSL